MAEYIDREVAKKMLDEYRISRTMSMYGDMDLLTEWREGVKCSMKKLDEDPTADVVPKSEVDELQHKYDLAVAEREANVKGFTDDLAKAKSEVAREIFAELEFDIANLDFDREETRAIAIEGIIAELKKKYTEENESVQT